MAQVMGLLLALALASGAHARLPDAPGAHCVYPPFQGYWAKRLGQQREVTRICLVRMAYEVAAQPPQSRDEAARAADFCAPAYMYEEGMRSTAERRMRDEAEARRRALAYVRPCILQARRLGCTPPAPPQPGA